jgi:uroporphyrinogen decarboxylase
MTSKRERLEKAIAGEAVDRVPVALWRHWPGDDQRAADLARSTVEFQRRYDWDFVKISPSSSFCLTDYGVQDEWVGNIEGTRNYTRRAIERTLDWTNLRPLDPKRGALGRQLEAAKAITAELGADVPAIQTIFSPLAQARNLVGGDGLIAHIRTAPERVHTGLNTITESTVRFIEELGRNGLWRASTTRYRWRTTVLDRGRIPGFRAAVRPADSGSPEQQVVVQSAAPARRRSPHVRRLHGLSRAGHELARPRRQTRSGDGKSRFPGAVCGGLSHWSPTHTGTPNEFASRRGMPSARRAGGGSSWRQAA